MNDEFMQNKKMKEFMRSSLLRQKKKMKDFVRSSLLQEQDMMHSYHTGAAYRLPVLHMNWTGNGLRSDR